MTNFDQIDPINVIFHLIYVHKPVWNNFFKLLEIKFIGPFPQISTYDVILPQNDPILTIFSKNDIFWPISPINDIFDQISVHKLDWNKF